MAKRIATIFGLSTPFNTRLAMLGIALGTGLYSLSAFNLAHAAEYQPKAYQAEYKLKRAGMTLGKANFSLTETASSQWRYASTVKPKGLARMFVKDNITIASNLLFIGGEVIPADYRYQRGGKKAETVSVDFDWANKVAAMTHNEQSQNVDLSSDHQDPYSLVLSIMQAAAAGQEEITKQVIDKRIKTRSFKLEKREKIDTSLGDLDTLKYVQNDDSSRTIHYWLAPSLNYIPVRIERYKKGELQAKLLIDELKWGQ